MDITTRKVVSALLVLALFLSPIAASAETAAEMQNRLNGANGQVNSLQGQVNQHAHEAATLEGQIGAMEAEIARVQAEVNATTGQINEMNARIAAVKAQAAEKRAVLNSHIQEEYFTPKATAFEVMVASNSLSEIVDREEYLAQSQKYINSLLSEIEAIRRELDAKMAELVKLKDNLAAQQAGLDAQRSALNVLLQKTRGEQARFQTMLQEAEANRDRINASLMWLARSGNAVSRGRVTRGQVIGYQGNTGNSTGTHLHFEVRQGGVAVNPMAFLGGQLSYPMNAVFTQGYGNTGFTGGGYSFHTGIDLAGPYGTPVQAAADGDIIVNAHVNDGYGHKIIIDHGNGLWTLYAHMQ